MDIPKSSIDLEAMHWRGMREIVAEGDAAEAEKAGTLRAGNTGCVTEDSRVIGACHRITHLRSLGIQSPPALATQLMFAAGISNEELWQQVLERVWDGEILAEEDIPIRWETSNETLVTGRPDLVLCRKPENGSPAPVLGLELKLVSSPFSGYNKIVKSIPDTKHVTQAAHYMWKLGVPFKIVYTSRSNYGLGNYHMAKKWDERHAKYLNEEGFKTIPYIKIFDLWAERGVVWCQPDDGEAFETEVTFAGIERYYELVSQIGKGVSLGPRPESVNVRGDSSYAMCSPKYCPFAETCDQYETDYERWLDEARLVASEPKE